jgi:N utilization substance protein A
MRIQSIVNELGGEKIDVVEWNSDLSAFIAHALSPAKVSYVVLDDPENSSKTATVVVPDDQLSLAIGKEGQNARLGAKLTGWRIDIKSASEASSEALKPKKRKAAAPTKERDILAMAEAILLGKDVPDAKEEPEPVEEQVPELELVPEATQAEAESEPEAPSIVAAAEALLAEERTETEPIVAEVEQEAATLEAPDPEVEVTAEVEPEAVPTAQVAEAEPQPEPQPEPEAEPEAVPAPAPRRRSQYRYVQDEQLEELVSSSKKPSRGKGRRRQLVLDEETGQLISRRRHKHSDDEYEWEDIDY